MVLLIAGLILWVGAHLLKRLAPGLRAQLGDAGKAVLGVVLLISLVMIIIGYRGQEAAAQIWSPPAFLTGINNLLMVLAVYLYAASGMKTRITRTIRHPQLTAVKAWAVAHLLVNGDLASIILFGTMLVWAVLEVILINRAARTWVRPDLAPMGKEIGAAVGTVIVTGLIAAIHTWLGYWPFGG